MLNGTVLIVCIDRTSLCGYCTKNPRTGIWPWPTPRFKVCTDNIPMLDRWIAGWTIQAPTRWAWDGARFCEHFLTIWVARGLFFYQQGECWSPCGITQRWTRWTRLPKLKDRITPHVTNFFRLRLTIEEQEGKRKYKSDGAVMVGEFVCMYVCSCTVSEWECEWVMRVWCVWVRDVRVSEVSEVKWSEVKWSEVKWSEVKWSEVKWSEVSGWVSEWVR